MCLPDVPLRSETEALRYKPLEIAPDGESSVAHTVAYHAKSCSESILCTTSPFSQQINPPSLVPWRVLKFQTRIVILCIPKFQSEATIANSGLTTKLLSPKLVIPGQWHPNSMFDMHKRRWWGWSNIVNNKSNSNTIIIKAKRSKIDVIIVDAPESVNWRSRHLDASSKLNKVCSSSNVISMEARGGLALKSPKWMFYNHSPECSTSKMACLKLTLVHVIRLGEWQWLWGYGWLICKFLGFRV